MRFRYRWLFQISAFLLLAAGIAGMTFSGTSKKDLHHIEFNRDIRPIIFKCFSCHGADAGARIMNLRLDQPEGAYGRLADGKHAIVPGHPEKSEMIARIFSKDPNYMMPPPNSNKFLSDEEKGLLKQWISEGAVYKPHWGFIPPVRYPIPSVVDKNWPKNAIDYFVLSKLEDNGLTPSPQADKRTLLRRVYLDLIGLPPTIDQINAFLNDKSPNAYEKVVDQLLASPRYGERMAMSWMDYSRYADSNGYQSDWERFQWRWRDWVIDAYNKDMPYNQFALEQIAGDLMPHATESDKIATGFNRNHRINTEGGVIPEEWRIENVIDRVSTTSETFLGLTAGCARCHDHKYDPITQKDFYSLCAYFNNVAETGSGVEMPVNHPPIMQAPYPWQEKEAGELSTKLVCLKSDLDDKLALNAGIGAHWSPPNTADPTLTNGLVARYRLSAHPSVTSYEELASQTPERPSGPLVRMPSGEAVPVPKAIGDLKPDVGRSTGSVYTSDNSYVDLGKVGDFDTHQAFSYGAWLNPEIGNGAAISRMDVSKDYRGWDLFFDGGRPMVHLINHWNDNALKVISKDTIPLNQWSHVMVTYDGSAKPEGLKIYINGKLTGYTVEVNSLKGTIRNNVTALLGRRTGGNNWQGRIDDAAIYNRALTAEEVASLANVSPAAPILSVPESKRTLEQRRTLDALYLRDKDPQYKAWDAERAKTQATYDKLEASIPTVMVMANLPKPRDCYVLIRGEYDHHGEKVYPAIPAALGKLPAGAPDNRLGLAEWITEDNNPLTARVAVNRMWGRLFGTGICATEDDFGTRADFPSHPELLDWLATEFVRLHWSQKAMWKEMVMSATYQQSAVATPQLMKIDPNNRLLARGPRYRLNGEVIRDQALLDGGLLVEKIGGPGVYPYQPAGIWDETNVYGNMRNYKHATDSGLYRRSLYTIWKRTAAPPNMTLFDVPSHEVCVIMRARTDTPMQALTLLDDVTYVEASRAIAMRMMKEGGHDVDSRLKFGFEVVLTRLPSPEELAILKKGYYKRLSLYNQFPDMAKELLSQGDLKNDPKLDQGEEAAYAVAASTLLNLDEAITKE